MRLVSLDIETAPALVYTFRAYGEQGIGMDQIVDHPRIIGFSYQWEGSKTVGWYSEYHHGRKEMLDAFHAILSEADAIMTYNGKTFDLPWILGELMIEEGYAPVPPVQHIDLYQILKGKTRFFLRKLDYAALRFLDERKVSHTGFLMWRECLMGNDDEKRKAWDLMRKYGKRDTALLFPLYEKIKGWTTTGHPNRALYDSVAEGCPVCASTNIQKRGYTYKLGGKYQRYQCQEDNCGKWFHGGKRLETTLAR